MPGVIEDWNDELYEDQDTIDNDGSIPSQGKRPRRRRRHGRKQAVGSSIQDSQRGTPLTLAQLGINLPPAPPARKNVVTWSDLDLGGGIVKRSQGDVDHRLAHPTPLVAVPTPQRPQSCSTIVATASSPWPSVETPLLASNPPHGSHLATGRHSYLMPARPDIPAACSMSMQPATTWVTDQVVAPRHWPCSGQYGFEPIIHQVPDSMPPPMVAFDACTAVATTPAPIGVAHAPAPVGCELEVLLKSLAAETYED